MAPVIKISSLLLYAWVAEGFLKWGGTSPRQKL